MSVTDEMKDRAHAAIKNSETRRKIQDIARDEGVSFNEAMKRFYSQK